MRPRNVRARARTAGFLLSCALLTAALFVANPASGQGICSALDRLIKLASRDYAGDLIGSDVRVVQEIGRGGDGRVFEGIAQRSIALTNGKVINPGDTVAVKVQRRGKRDPSVLMNEIDMAERLHDGGPYFLGAYLGPRQRFLVMEYVPGSESLADYALRSQESPLTPGQAERFTKQLREAHSILVRHGIVHGDLCPQNILIVKDRNGDLNIRIIDFGSAALVGRYPFSVGGTRRRTFHEGYATKSQIALEPAALADDQFAVDVLVGMLANISAP